MFDKPLKPLVSATWLKQHLDDVVLIECDMQPIIGIEPIVYQQKPVIPGAYYLDVNRDLCDSEHVQTHKMANLTQIGQCLSILGINRNTIVVLYDAQGIYSAPRAWWTLKCFGLEHIYVLNGGLPAWQAHGFSTQNDYVTRPLKPSTTNPEHARLDEQRYQQVAEQIGLSYNPLRCIDKSQILPALADGAYLLDARSTMRFFGKAVEPRAGVRSGHIPASLNLPFTSLLASGHYPSDESIKSTFDKYNITEHDRVIYSCGSGITACILILAAWQIGYINSRLYDGSWAEWGREQQLPISVADDTDLSRR